MDAPVLDKFSRAAIARTYKTEPNCLSTAARTYKLNQNFQKGCAPGLDNLVLLQLHVFRFRQTESKCLYCCIFTNIQTEPKLNQSGYIAAFSRNIQTEPKWVYCCTYIQTEPTLSYIVAST